MKRGPRLFLAMAIVCAGLAVTGDGWSRVACICAAVTCLIAYFKPSATNRQASTDPAAMPVGTVIELDGMTARKARRSDRDPQPWTSGGVAYSDEWAAGVIAGGAQARKPGGRRG